MKLYNLDYKFEFSVLKLFSKTIRINIECFPDSSYYCRNVLTYLMLQNGKKYWLTKKTEFPGCGTLNFLIKDDGVGEIFNKKEGLSKQNLLDLSTESLIVLDGNGIGFVTLNQYEKLKKIQDVICVLRKNSNEIE